MPEPTSASSASCRAATWPVATSCVRRSSIDPDPSLRVVTQEQFGPVIPIIPFDTEDEAVAARERHLGRPVRLGVDRRHRLREPRRHRKLVCGYVWVNDHGATRLDLRAPFGGMKQSGIGREQGIEGIRAFQDTRSIAHIDAEALAAQAH